METSSGNSKYYVQHVNNIAILYMNNGQNRFNEESVSLIHKALDEVERSDAKALITTGVGKFYSNGIDTTWVSQQDIETAIKFRISFRKIQKRLLLFPIPTIAAINGHAYAGGALLTFFHDYRIMRSRRGWFCVAEIHLNLTIGEASMAVMNRRYPASVVREMVQFGKRYIAEELLEVGVVDAVTENAGLLDLAVSMAKDIIGRNCFDREALMVMKENLYCEVLKAFDSMELGIADSMEKFKQAASKL
ncbi:uncharacterized protein LOC144438110 [Glandiceps talaboti]